MVNRVDVTLTGIGHVPIPVSFVAPTVAPSAVVPVPTVHTGVTVGVSSIASIAAVPGVSFSRDTLVPGDYMPDATTAGVLPGVSRTTLSGDQSITSGTTISNRNITGRVVVSTAETVTLINCWIYGNSSLTSEHGVVTCTNVAVANVVLIDCTICPSTPTAYMTGVLGHHFRLTRCHIKNCVDGVGVYNNNTGHKTEATGVIVEQCFIEKHSWFTNAPNQDDGSHCDGVQIQGGADTIIRYNNISTFNDSSVGNSPWSRVTESGEGTDPFYRGTGGLMCTPNVGAITNIVITGNWFWGAEIMNNTSHPGTAVFIGTWSNNRYGRDSYGGHTIDFGSSYSYSASGNVYDDNDSAVTIRSY